MLIHNKHLTIASPSKPMEGKDDQPGEMACRKLRRLADTHLIEGRFLEAELTLNQLQRLTRLYEAI